MKEHNSTIPEYSEPPRARDFRRMAREALEGNWWRMALVMLVFLLLTTYRQSNSFRVEYNYRNVPPATSSTEDHARPVRERGRDNLHSSVGFGPYSYSSVQPLEPLDDRPNVTLLRSLSHPYEQGWRSLPTGIRAFAIGASILSLGLVLITPALHLGLYQAMSELYDRKRPRVSALFSQFRHFGKALWLGIIMTFFTVLWFLLLIVPGIIAIYRYSMAYYFLWRDPNLRAIDALRKSKEYMRGNKGRLFCLQFSYIGWVLFTLVPTTVLPRLGVPITRSLAIPSSLFAPMVFSLFTIYALVVNIFLYSYRQAGEFAFFRHLEGAESESDAEPV